VALAGGAIAAEAINKAGVTNGGRIADFPAWLTALCSPPIGLCLQVEPRHPSTHDEQQPFAWRLRKPGGQGAGSGKVTRSASRVGECRRDVALMRDLAPQAALGIEQKRRVAAIETGHAKQNAPIAYRMHAERQRSRRCGIM